jgi:hypothetical protein
MSKKYYKNLETGSVYKSEPVQCNDGVIREQFSRWNWDFENWSGHIHDWDGTIKKKQEGKVIVPITKEEAKKILNKVIK